MNDQSLPLKKQPRRLGLSRNVTQDDIVYEHVFDAIWNSGWRRVPN